MLKAVDYLFTFPVIFQTKSCRNGTDRILRSYFNMLL